MPKNRYLLLIAIMAAMAVLGLSKRPEKKMEDQPMPQPETAWPLTGAANQLGFDLFAELAKNKPEENLFISPYSIHSALCMAYSGAKGNTASAMAAAIYVTKWTLPRLLSDCSDLRQGLASSDSLVRLDIANSLWSRQGLPLKADFKAGVEKYFNGLARELDFGSPQAVQTINGWVRERTNDKIKTIIERIPPNAALYLINAVYFKGKWQQQFDQALSRDRDFFLPGGGAKKMPFMRQDGEFSYLKGEGFQAVRLPYGRGRFAMYVFLPDRKEGLKALLGSINADNFGLWLGSFQRTKGHVELPRFRADYFQDLVPALDKLGMGPAFGASADFTGMGPVGLSIDEVRHKTVLEVNEEGTEAAAVTSIGVRVTSVRPEAKPFEMIVDHPFFLAIVDGETRAILFLGAIYEPK